MFQLKAVDSALTFSEDGIGRASIARVSLHNNNNNNNNNNKTIFKKKSK